MCSALSSIRFTADRRGVSAVEFALLAPVALVMMCGLVAYGLIFSTHISLQQLVAETTRATVSGITPEERSAIARDHLSRTIDRYPLLRADAADVSVISAGGMTEVRLYYDATGHPAYVFEGLLPLPARNVTYRQSIRDGGL
ncbi:pilus assembly protein [Glycocaulis profundi]|nr:pilus assembly protein [Glycocaulis profundi]